MTDILLFDFRINNKWYFAAEPLYHTYRLLARKVKFIFRLSSTHFHADCIDLASITACRLLTGSDADKRVHKAQTPGEPRRAPEKISRLAHREPVQKKFFVLLALGLRRPGEILYIKPASAAFRRLNGRSCVFPPRSTGLLPKSCGSCRPGEAQTDNPRRASPGPRP